MINLKVEYADCEMYLGRCHSLDEAIIVAKSHQEMTGEIGTYISWDSSGTLFSAKLGGAK